MAEEAIPAEKGNMLLLLLLSLSHPCDDDDSQIGRLSKMRSSRRRSRTSRSRSCVSSRTVVAFVVTLAFFFSRQSSFSSVGCVGASSSSAVDSSSTTGGSGAGGSGDDEEKFSTLFRYLLSMSLCVFGLMTVYFHQYAASAFIRQYFDDTKTTTVKGRVVCCQSLTKTSSNVAPSHPPKTHHYHHHLDLQTKNTAANITSSTTNAHNGCANAMTDVEAIDVQDDDDKQRTQNFSLARNEDHREMLHNSSSGTAKAKAVTDHDHDDRQVRIMLDPVTRGADHELVPNSFSTRPATAAAAANPNLKVNNSFMMDVSALSVNSATDSQYYSQEYLEMTDSNTAEPSPSFATSFDCRHDGCGGGGGSYDGSSSRPNSGRVRRNRQKLQRFLLNNNNERHEQEEHNTSSNSNGNIYVHHSNKKYRVFVLYQVSIPAKNQHHDILCGGGSGDPTTAASAVSNCCKQPTEAILDMYHTGPTGGGGITGTSTTTTAPPARPSQSRQIVSSIGTNKVVEYQQIYLSDQFHHVNSWVDLIMLKDFPTSACTREVLQEQLLHIEKNSSPATTKSSMFDKMMKCGTVKIVTACSIIGFIVLMVFSLSEVSGLSTVNGDRSKGYYMVSIAVVGSIIASYMICKALNEHYIRRAFLSAVPSPVQPTTTSSTSTSTSQPWQYYNHPQLVHHKQRLQQQLQDQHQQEHFQYHELRKMADGGQGQDQTMDDSMMTNATPLPPSKGMFQHCPPAPPNPTRPFVSLTTGSSSKKIPTGTGSSSSINAPHDFSGSGTSTSTEKFSNVQQSFVRRSSHRLMIPQVDSVGDGNLETSNGPRLSNDGVTVPAG